MNSCRPSFACLATGALVALVMLSGCATTDPGRLPEPPAGLPLAGLPGQAPEGAPAGTCWDRIVTPARISTTTEQVLDRPAVRDASGTVLAPAVFRIETRQEIIEERQETWFETPCPDILTEDFVASVQRALGARGLYVGPITGELNLDTRRAIGQYQGDRGLASQTLALTTAQELGLVSIDPQPTPPD
ncbi:MAG: peptidoglycan-binding domain-containing protein [Pseudomonadota bacterium]